MTKTTRERRRRLADLIPSQTVYFVRAEALGLVKVGLTGNLADRLKTLRVGCPDQITLIAAYYGTDAAAVEAELHGDLAQWHSHGEWFKPNPVLDMMVETFGLDAYQAAITGDLRGALQKVALV
jgi:hypothetical protein